MGGGAIGAVGGGVSIRYPFPLPAGPSAGCCAHSTTWALGATIDLAMFPDQFDIADLRQLDSRLRRHGVGMSFTEVDVMQSTTMLNRRIVAPDGAVVGGRFAPTSR